MSKASWWEASRTLRASVPYRALRDRLGEITRLPAGAAAWVLTLLSEDLGRPQLVLVPREADARAWLEAAQLFCGDGIAVDFPAPALTPYQETSVPLPVRAREMDALDRMLHGEARVLVTTPRGLFRRLPTPATLRAATVELARGRDLPPQQVVARLLEHGYRRADLVLEVGDLAVRGGIVDLYPPGRERPVRIDYFGDTIETLREFDPESQRSVTTLQAVRVPPLAPFPLGAGAAARLADELEALAGPEPQLDALERIERLRREGSFAGWDHLLPLAAGETVGLPELLAEALVVALDPPALRAEAEAHAQRLAAEAEARGRRSRLAVPPERLEAPLAAVLATLGQAGVRIGGEAAAGAIDFAASPTDLLHGQIQRLPREAETVRARGERLVLVALPGQRRRLESLVEDRDLGGVEVVEGRLERGFRLPAAGLTLLAEGQLFPPVAPAAPARRARYGPFISDLRDLRVGDYVVHEDHGIGQFLGLRAVAPEEDGDGSQLPESLREAAPQGAAGPIEVMELVYGGGRRLLLPLSRLDRLQKYSGIEGVAPRLDELGGASWNRTKERVRKGLRKLAFDLLKLDAARRLARAPAMGPDSPIQHDFEAAFAHEETADQTTATRAIKEDLAQERPMDRLLCGDVGFGKTEVAMRAAFKAVDNGYQVAVLAPTTILADQHLETFRRRFAAFPVKVEMLSRFRSPAEVQRIRGQVRSGEMDILVGTHRMLGRDLDFARLGLLIVDEEQRFGVGQKERLKELRKSLHVLSLSATPVPRTLQLALSGVRDLSVIETPPQDRMAVETTITPLSDELVREAVELELARGGQVYYVYNRVETIDKVGARLRELLPGVRLTVGHGQLPEDELARRMHAFNRGEHDLLLATTIIENGIDIPNVNTMFVHDADRFGLAQLYQLRGRVGRSDRLAFCYLLFDPDRRPSEAARRRLEAIQEFTDLGAGFRIAARDLEIRGAGNLLGAEQSGHMAAVGIETYLKMLEEAVQELKGEAIAEAPSVALDLPLSLTIPTDYVPDANLRMEIYRRIARGGEPEEELVAELRDRFGPPPDTVRTLLEVAALKRRAEALRVQAISGRSGRLTIRLRRDSRIDVDRLIQLVAEQEGAQFSPTGVLTLPGGPPSEILQTARRTLEALAS